MSRKVCSASAVGGLRNRGARVLVFLMSALLVMPPAWAAGGPRTSEFEQWQSAQASEYQSWLSAQDRAFSEALRKDWEAFQVQKPQKRDPAPKPALPPVVPESVPPPVAPKPEPKPLPPPVAPKPEPKPLPPPVAPKPEPKPLPPPVAPKPEPKPLPPPVAPKPEPKPLPPPVAPKPEPKPLPPPVGTTPVSLKMFGEPLALAVPTKLGVPFKDRPTPNAIANHFERLASVPGTQELVDTLSQVARDHRLNTWGRLVLLNEASAGMHSDVTSRRMLTWFLAMKSGIDARIGFSDTSVQLLLPFTTTVYGVSFFTMEGQNYYLMDPADPRGATPGSLSTYRQPYDKAQIVDLTFRDAVLTKEVRPAQRAISFAYKGQTYGLQVNLDPALVGVYDSVPITDLSVYFNSTWRSPVRDQLRKQLQPLLKGRSERDSINFLLRFIQKGIAYKTDEDQFQRENYLFPDQTLFYPFSDCEDRSILFAALVKDLLGVQVIGLAYPGHVATAVLIPVVGAEDTIEWQGKRYVVADPTYIGADAGMAQPGMTAASARVVEIKASN